MRGAKLYIIIIPGPLESVGGTLNVGHDQVIELLQVLLLVKIGNIQGIYRECGGGGLVSGM